MSYCQACRPIEKEDYNNLEIHFGICQECGRTNRVIRQGYYDNIPQKGNDKKMKTLLSREDYEKLVDANKVFVELEEKILKQCKNEYQEYVRACGKVRSVIINSNIEKLQRRTIKNEFR